MPSLDRSDAVPLLLTAPAFVLLAWWSVAEGGYAPARWLPGAILAPALLAMTVLALGARLARPSRATMLALAALGAYVAWSFASIVWADAPGDALEGSQRALLYFNLFALFALTPWTPRALRGALAAFSLLVAALGAVTLLRASGAEDPLRFLLDARLSAPVGYQNAAAALWTMAALPALVLASRRDTALALRPLLLAAAGLLLGLSVLAQSRGWLFTLPVVGIAVLSLVPGRARLLIAVVAVGVALGLVLDELLGVSRAAGGMAPADAAISVRAPLDAAARALALATLGLLLVGAVLVAAERVLERRMNPSARLRAIARRLSRAMAVALVSGVAVAGWVALDGHPLDRIDQAWTEFKDVGADPALSGGDRFTSLGSGRYDFWRVAVSAWQERPLLGLGQDTFAETYVARRVVAEEPRWVHSLPLRLLVHTGLVGAVLFVLFAACALAAFISAARGSPVARIAGAAALLPATVWLAHGSVDWLWEFPLLSGSALAFAGATSALSRSSEVLSGRGPRTATIGVIVAAVASAVIGASTFLAQRDTGSAARGWPDNPQGALKLLDRAARLNPLGDRAPLVEGLVAVELGRFERADDAFAQAARRRPEGWYARFAQSLVAMRAGRSAEARRHLAAARARNPREPLIAEATRRLRRGQRLTFAEARQQLAERLRQRRSRQR